MAEPGALIWKDHLNPGFMGIARKLVFLSGTLIIFLFFLAATFEHSEALLRLAIAWILVLGIGYIFLNRSWKPTGVTKSGLLLPDMREQYSPFRMLIAANRAAIFLKFRDISGISLDYDPYVIDSYYCVTVKSGKKSYYNILQNPKELLEAIRSAGHSNKIMKVSKFIPK
jgi:hypothetical protein